ncbi:MAG: hypothetical protein PHX78_07560 [bacterium]|nr:hypothetical protein [bacterium]
MISYIHKILKKVLIFVLLFIGILGISKIYADDSFSHQQIENELNKNDVKEQILKYLESSKNYAPFQKEELKKSSINDFTIKLSSYIVFSNPVIKKEQIIMVGEFPEYFYIKKITIKQQDYLMDPNKKKYFTP